MKRVPAAATGHGHAGPRWHQARSRLGAHSRIHLFDGAVSPKDGTRVYLIMPTSNTACFQAFLNVLSRKFARRDILLVLDGAPNHRSSELVLPGNISALFPPPHAPELKPPPATPLSFAELSLWLAPPKENPCDDIREKIFKNHALTSIDAVRAKPEEAI
jgi:hypothetical protein